MDAVQVVSIAGAAMVLGAFAALQFRKVGPRSPVYLVLNVLGSGCLAVAAALESLWAFVVLNSVWGLVSLRSLLQVNLDRRRTPPVAETERSDPLATLAQREDSPDPG